MDIFWPVPPFIPSETLIKTAGVPLAILTLLTGVAVGFVRKRSQWATAYTRKLFHAVVFTTAGILQLSLGLGAVSLYGTLVVVLLLIAVTREDTSNLYRALARDKDRPHRTLFILVPMLATGLGGVVSNICFGDWAVTGYLLCGLGDAAAEPVGECCGKHSYSVPGLAGITVNRTVEGSASVFLVGTPAVLAGLMAQQIPFTPALYLSVLGGLVGVAVEALSHHGLDNLTLQVAVSGSVWGVSGWLL